MAKLKQNKVLSTNILLGKQLRTLEKQGNLKTNWVLRDKNVPVLQSRLRNSPRNLRGAGRRRVLERVHIKYNFQKCSWKLPEPICRSAAAPKPSVHFFDIHEHNKYRTGHKMPQSLHLQRPRPGLTTSVGKAISAA